ncbi:hypothetical protein PUP68_11755 [Pseudomonas chlororaphis]|uniref:hypothetical protein n=1 Tax=Pseudomonas chlororaphis TaxID=587753 RepID=UPI002368E565|nr:hypothetical protein [Pseudomonas chlororaphis]WDG79201.1 hypothetical protein PUP77_00485 [Pseudomonas chlororaphis]WDG87747.1 hypothetical protein PUP68_11755 [Pseudomonas chlororaphis]
MPEESTKGLREQIIQYMTEKKDDRTTGIPTWWFKFSVPGGTPKIRRELEKMEREGLAESDHRQSNNTLWKLIEPVDEVAP